MLNLLSLPLLSLPPLQLSLSLSLSKLLLLLRPSQVPKLIVSYSSSFTTLLLILLLVLLTSTGIITNIEAKQHKIWPHPQMIHLTDDYYHIDSARFRFLSNVKCDIITRAIQRYRDRMFTQDCGKVTGDQRINRFAPTWEIGNNPDYVNGNHVMGNLWKLNIRMTGGLCERYPQEEMNERFVCLFVSNLIHNIFINQDMR